MFNFCWSHFCPLIPKVRRQNATVSKFSRKINQKEKLQINIYIYGKLKKAFEILVTQRSNQAHYKVTRGPCNHFMMRVRASVSIAITLLKVLGQPYLHKLPHLCVYLEGR